MYQGDVITINRSGVNYINYKGDYEMIIQIINDEYIIINGVKHEYIKYKGRVIIKGITDDNIINAVKYLFYNKEASNPLANPPAFRDIRRDGNTIGVIYMTVASTYNAVVATPECGIRIETFLDEKLAKYFVLTEYFEPEIDYENIPVLNRDLRKDKRNAAPGIFNMLYHNHRFAGFIFNHLNGTVEGFNIDFQRAVFENRHHAREHILYYIKNMV